MFEIDFLPLLHLISFFFIHFCHIERKVFWSQLQQLWQHTIHPLPAQLKHATRCHKSKQTRKTASRSAMLSSMRDVEERMTKRNNNLKKKLTKFFLNFGSTGISYSLYEVYSLGLFLLYLSFEIYG